MSDPSRMDLFRSAGQLVGTGVKFWGVTQEQRRAAEYSKAVADAREGYRVLLQDIEKENDYTLHQTMFDRGVGEIRKTVGDQWLGDLYVRNRFDLQWEDMTQAARGAAMNYSWAAEKTALQVDMFNQIKDFFQSSLETAHANARGLINEFYEAGIIDPRVEEQAWEYYRQQGQHALKARVDAAIEARDHGRVRSLYDTAITSSIIEDPDLAADMMKAAQYAISVGWAEDVAMATYRQLGVDAVIAWLQDPDTDEMSMLELEDQARVTRFVRESIGFGRAEEEFAAQKLDTEFMQYVQEWESKIINGDMTWAEGITLLNTEAAKDALLPNNWQRQIDRFRIREAQEEQDRRSGIAGGPTDTQLASALMLEIRYAIDNGADKEATDALILGHGLAYRLSYSQADELYDRNANRGENSRELNMVEALISTVVASERVKGNIPPGANVDYAVHQLTEELFANLAALSRDPLGRPLSDTDRDARIQNYVTARLGAAELTRRTWIGRTVGATDATVLQDAERGAYTGIIPPAITRSLTTMPTNLQGDELRRHINEAMFGDVASPTAEQQNRIEVAARLTKINRDSRTAFEREYGTPVRVHAGADGIAYFFRVEPDPEVDGGTMEVPYRREVNAENRYEWRAYREGSNGRGAWMKRDRAAEDAKVEAEHAEAQAWNERIGGGAAGTIYEATAARTAPGGSSANTTHYFDIQTLAPKMVTIRGALNRLTTADREVFDRVHAQMLNTAGRIELMDTVRIDIIVKNLPEIEVQEDEESTPAEEFTDAIDTDALMERWNNQ